MTSEASDEAARLAALAAYRILDTPPEAPFDDLARLAAQICETPVSLVSLVDEHRQWFKSRLGFQPAETHRSLSFCAHAIRRGESLYEVPDARADALFRDNALVTGPPGIRFYAGAPLVAPGGERLGTLCVIDHVPRRLDDRQRAALSALSRQVVALLELRVANEMLEARVEARTRELAHAAAEMRALAVKLERVREEERTRISREIHDELGQMLTALKMDLTLAARDAQRAALPAGADLQAMTALVDRTLAAVRRIARDLRPEALDALGLTAALETQADELCGRAGIACRVSAAEPAPVLDAAQRTALFRIAQEALTNVARHSRAAQVRIAIAERGDTVELTVEDDGRGFDPAASAGSLGLIGMRERAAMVGATLEIASCAGAGTRVQVRVPRAAAARATP